jgi:hypothetical protein
MEIDSLVPPEHGGSMASCGISVSEMLFVFSLSAFCVKATVRFAVYEIQIAVRSFDGFMATVAPGRLLSHLSPQDNVDGSRQKRHSSLSAIAGHRSQVMSMSGYLRRRSVNPGMATMHKRDSAERERMRRCAQLLHEI